VPRVDPRFERIAARLTVLQLQPPADDDAPRFAQFYSPDGIKNVIHEYGLHQKLVAQGLGDYVLRIDEEDAWRQRLELAVPEGQIMDLRLHLQRAQVAGVDEHADLVVIDWLLMQNPRASFSRERPRLPGQTHPGTGLGRDVAQLLVLLCRRVGRDGLLVVPERFHLAELYRRGGWRALRRSDDRGARFDYVPHGRLLPVSASLERAVAPGGFLALKEISGLFFAPRRFHVDVAGLQASLREGPVEGMDPDDLRR
jgi:hypothetical protein